MNFYYCRFLDWMNINFCHRCEMICRSNIKGQIQLNLPLIFIDNLDYHFFLSALIAACAAANLATGTRNGEHDT